MSRHHHHLNAGRWARARRAALDRDGWACQQPMPDGTICGRRGLIEAHHPLDVAGRTRTERMTSTTSRPYAAACHIEAHGKTPESPERRAWGDYVRELQR